MILKPFNAVFFLVLGIGLLLIILPYLKLRDADEKIKARYIYIVDGFNFVLYMAYKIWLLYDPEYLELLGESAIGVFEIVPLHFCNINLLLIPIALYLRNEPLMGFSFFTAPLAAFMAMASPLPAFNGFSVFAPRMIGYYGTHLLIIVTSVNLGTLGFCKPEIKKIPKILLTILALSLSIHGINFIIRHTLCPAVNYFYTFGTEGVSALEFFWNIIPVPYLYELLMFPIAGGYMVIVCLMVKLIARCRAKRALQR